MKSIYLCVKSDASINTASGDSKVNVTKADKKFIYKREHEVKEVDHNHLRIMGKVLKRAGERRVIAV